MPLFDLTVVEARRMLVAGAVTPEQYRVALRERAAQAAAYNTTVTFVAAPPSAPSGPLQHIPIVVKDNIDVAGAATTAGTPGLIANVATGDAGVVRGLVAAGAHVSGKNVMHELALGATTNNPLHGAAHNPWQHGRTAGGSSGGTAAAVALGIAPAGIGTDTGGSVRVPAALCGVFGFRPSIGRYPNDGIVPICLTRDTAGPIARSLEDIVVLDSVLARRVSVQPAPAIAEIRLGFTPVHFTDLDSDVAEATDRARRDLEKLGATSVLVDIDDLVAEAFDIAPLLVWGEFRAALSGYLAAGHISDVDGVLDAVRSPDVSDAIARGLDSVTSDLHRRALATRDRLRTELTERCRRAGIHALLFPTTPVVAPLLGQDDTIELAGRRVPTFATIIRHGDLGGVLGLPGISVPIGLGTASGLPVGIELSAPPGRDDTLLAVAGEVSRHIARPHRPSSIRLAALGH
ncbi:Indoleacetamide hydrolase [Rhodococcus sp. AW25M09]|uniref:amidase family protein n=1 Tax=Rhodococcus sp. AW25M09 TaxID=1268303 RepID=UPI0002ABED9B|nr:amidase family protein [Rhodococcus sp. AW25M09]CCQ13452.1 Indoleacetamide hydrolase [Rhodococcus sp. AW25M09]